MDGLNLGSGVNSTLIRSYNFWEYYDAGGILYVAVDIANLLLS